MVDEVKCTGVAALQGCRVLVPRPLFQGRTLCELIVRQGGEAVHFPVLEIVEPADIEAFEHHLRCLQAVDLVVFVSVSAVDRVARALRRHRLHWPQQPQVAVFGHRSAARCEFHGIRVDHVPVTTMDSEGLLDVLGPVALDQRQVVIFRGQSGREWLRQALLLQGASVEMVECYRRVLTQRPIEPVVKQWKDRQIDVVVVTSNSIVDGLLNLLGRENSFLFRNTPIVAISQRIGEYCRRKGVVARMRISSSPSDTDIVSMIGTMHRGRNLP